MRIHAKDTVAIAVDLQERLIPAMHDKEALIHNAGKLLAGLEILEVPVLVSRQYPKGIGETVPEIQAVTKKAAVFEKMTFSCYQEPAIREAVEKLKPRNVIVCGTEAHVCVLQTAIDLQAAGYQVIYVMDCVGSRKASDKKYGAKRAAHEGAILSTYEQILFELLANATTPYFKPISNLLK